MSNVHVLYAGNDTVLQLSELQDEVSGSFLDGADVSVTVADEQGNPVGGATWPMSLVHVAGSKGIYRTTLPYTLDLQPGRRYSAYAVAHAGPGLHAEWQIECVARTRN